MPASVLRRRFRLLTIVMLYASVAAIAASTILAELGETWWIADLFAHFRYHYVVGAVLLALVALALGRRGAGIVAALLIVPQLWAMAAPPRTPLAEKTPAATTLRVMSVNVLWSNQRFDDVAAAIERELPDVVSLQEIWPRWYPVLERLTARYPHVAPADWRNGTSDNIVLSRWPIGESRVVVPPKQYRPFGHVDATVLVNGRPIRVLAVHPPLPASGRHTETRQANLDYYAQVAAATETPLLIVGDFNITPYSPRFRALLREGGLRYVHLGWGWPRSWPSASRGNYQRYIRGFPIDHILTSSHFAVTSARSLEDVGSDHYPVVADLVLLR
jgi:endonuclease/exonuclease/phosphatase (EEP) superfamily protein YafD